MGGHGHQPYKIPSPDVYKVEDVPELKRVQEELAKKGLKDPWLRNHVWRYKGSQGYSTGYKRALITATRGWRIGIPAFLITIAVEQYFGIDYSGHGHGHGHGDGDGHH